MKAEKKWQKRLAAVVLGAMVAGMPLFAAEAESQSAFSPDGERYNVRRGMYEKEGGSDEHVRLGQYADEQHREARNEQRREDLDKRQNEERKDFEKRQSEERKDFEDRQRQEREHRGHENEEQHKDHRNHEHGEHRDEHSGQHRNQAERREHREYRYDVRRGMYEQEGGSDTEVRRGQYEQPSEDGMRRGLVR